MFTHCFQLNEENKLNLLKRVKIYKPRQFYRIGSSDYNKINGVGQGTLTEGEGSVQSISSLM
jgi:hypothetical protein